MASIADNCESRAPIIWPTAPTDVSFLLVTQATSLLVAAAGNILVAFLILRSQCLRTEPAYKLICSLCVADILVSLAAQPLCVIRMMAGQDENRELDHVLFFTTWGFCGASAFGVVLVTFERLIYIHYPLHYRTITTSGRINVMIAVQWTGGLAFGGLPLVSTTRMHESAIAALVTLNAMILVLMVAYFKIYKASQKHRRTIKILQSTMAVPQPSRRNHATVTIAMIVLAFAVCWYPHIIANFIWSHCKKTTTDAWKDIWYWLLSLGYLNSAINVLIYGLKNKTLLKEAKLFLGLRRAEIGSRPRSSTQTELMSNQIFANIPALDANHDANAIHVLRSSAHA